MRETRSKIQVAANKLDLEVFRLVDALDQFAVEHKNPKIRVMASDLNSMRYLVRKYMHKRDQEATNA